MCTRTHKHTDCMDKRRRSLVLSRPLGGRWGGGRPARAAPATSPARDARQPQRSYGKQTRGISPLNAPSLITQLSFTSQRHGRWQSSRGHFQGGRCGGAEPLWGGLWRWIGAGSGEGFARPGRQSGPGLGSGAVPSCPADVSPAAGQPRPALPGLRAAPSSPSPSSSSSSRALPPPRGARQGPAGAAPSP